MGKNAPVVVNRRGFGSSLVVSLFGTFCVLIVCVTCVAIYGVKVVNERLDSIIEISPEAITALTNWQQALPPAVKDAINDRRMPGYRDKVAVTTRLVRDWKTERLVPVVEVTNDGDQVVSLLSLRLQVEDNESLPVEELTVYAATPLAIEGEWRGPLLPGSTRRFKAHWLRTSTFGELNLKSEICELRVWDTPHADSESAAAAPADLTLTSDSQPTVDVLIDTGDAEAPSEDSGQ
jgi:hypothetical protein